MLAVSRIPFGQHLVMVGLFFSAPASIADEAESMPRFTHARFVDGDHSMKSLVEFPDIGFDVDVTVTCSGKATAKGRLRHAKCSSPNDPDLEFTMAVSRRFNSVRLVPATIDGRVEEVDFQFVVAFSKTGDTESIDLFLNNRKNVDRLGLDYISAQRYSPAVWPTRCAGWRLDDLIVEVAIVDATGHSRDVNVMSSTAGIPTSCRTGLINQLENGRWIPASYQGQYVDSVWVSPIILNRVGYKREQ
jgi:hypothetical protein